MFITLFYAFIWPLWFREEEEDHILSKIKYGNRAVFLSIYYYENDGGRQCAEMDR